MPKKVLVIDKDPSVQAFFEKTLTPEKFTLSGINDGISALDMLDKIQPDLILVEFALYGIDVFRFCEKVKQKNQEKERPVILTVGPEDQYDAGRLLSLGVMAILKKPLDPKLLLEKMQELSEETATLIDRKPAATAPPAPGIPPGPEAAPAQPAVPKEDSMKIEEMLGWSLPSDKSEDSLTQKASPVPAPQADPEQTVVLKPGETVQTPQAPPPAPAPDLEQTMVVPPAAGAPTHNEDVFLAKPPPPASGPGDLDQTMIIETPMGGPGQKKPVPQTPSPAAAPVVEPAIGNSQNGALRVPLDEARVAELIRAAAQLIIERVSWDVIPGAAEAGMKDLPPATAETLAPKTAGNPAPTPSPELELKNAEPLVRQLAKEIIEKVALEAVPGMAGSRSMEGGPGPAGPGNAGGSFQSEPHQVVEQIAREVIEKVAWEVVPGLAEDFIKKGLSKVKTGP